jgi:hypothetical protein
MRRVSNFMVEFLEQRSAVGDSKVRFSNVQSRPDTLAMGDDDKVYRRPVGSTLLQTLLARSGGKPLQVVKKARRGRPPKNKGVVA